MDKHIFRALAQYWNNAYSCFSFGKVYLVPTVEEYTTLLRCPKIQIDKAYSRAANSAGFDLGTSGYEEMSRHFHLEYLWVSHLPKALGRVDNAVSDLFDWLDKRVTPFLTILVETFRSLTACRRAVFSKDYSPLKEFIAIPRQDNIFIKSGWQFSKVSKTKTLNGGPLSRQFIPTSQGLAQCEFAYKGDNYKKKVREISNAWNRSHKMKRFTTNPMTTPEYDWWYVRDRKVRLQKEEFIAREKDRNVRRGKDLARIKRRRAKDLLESRNEKVGLRARIVELERSLHQYRSRNFVVELKASLTKIEELKGKIKELEPALQNFELLSRTS
ncbi:hypothetical protein Golax_003209 [Gossypium laxum]|uniref:Aminotransferase-like plant mobile domain-containing protein n=1 Tax=Gossypium laxum TaxID=34288 RepID=A0A7J9AF70_9ROSI|nr:hypothetical protein [Gossypium laxum]